MTPARPEIIYGFLNFHAGLDREKHPTRQALKESMLTVIGRIIARQEQEQPETNHVYWLDVILNPLESLENKLLNDVIRGHPQTGRILLLRAESAGQAERMTEQIGAYFDRAHGAKVEITMTKEDITPPARESIADKVARQIEKQNKFRELQARYNQARG